MGRTACTKPQCLYKCALYLYPYLYSPYGPYCLYRTSVPVQRCTLPLPIPLLPHKSCTTCTDPHCLYTCALYLYLYLYSPYGPTACTEPQCLYKGAPLPLPIPLLPLWTYSLYRASVPVQGCTFTFTYTSIPPMGRTACTGPQCLYNGALYLYLYLYSPYEPYCLYRASVPVQRCTLPLPIPLLPHMGRTTCTDPHCLYKCALYLYLYFYSLIRAVRPVQNLSACTSVHFTFTYTSTPPMDLQPVQSLSACTTVHFNFTYTSTPPMDLQPVQSLSACTRVHLYLYLTLISALCIT